MLWLTEKMQQAKTTDYGDSLFSVQSLLKKNQSLKNEVDNHEPRIISICEDGEKLIRENHPDSAEFKQLIKELQEELDKLRSAMDYRKGKLLESEKAQKYYYEASGIIEKFNEFNHFLILF